MIRQVRSLWIVFFASTIAALFLTSLAKSDCNSGCLEGLCFKSGTQCYEVSRTDCVKEADLCFGDPTRGAVGGVGTDDADPLELATWYKVPGCSKECSQDYSRCNNSSSMSTCSGTRVFYSSYTVCYCAAQH